MTMFLKMNNFFHLKSKVLIVQSGGGGGWQALTVFLYIIQYLVPLKLEGAKLPLYKVAV